MKIPIQRLLRPCVRGITPYSPGKPAEEVEREYGLKDAVKLASNENALGPSPLALAAVLEAARGINIYPDGGAHYLRQKLSGFLGVPPEWIITGNGSDEIIRIIAETFLDPGEEAVVSSPSFVVYETAARVMNAGCAVVPLRDDFSYDTGRILDSVTEKTKLVFFANPNNPTGTVLPAPEAEMYMKSVPGHVITVFDEAYLEYVISADYPDSMDFLRSGAPVVILRTFSKIYGLAGLRIGYGVTRPEMAAEMNRVRQPFNVNSLAQAAAMAALDDIGHLAKSRALNEEGKKYLYRALDGLGLQYVPTEGNFILVNAGSVPSAAGRLLEKGVIVRGMSCYGLDGWFRVTIGLKRENEKFMEALGELQKGK